MRTTKKTNKKVYLTISQSSKIMRNNKFPLGLIMPFVTKFFLILALMVMSSTSQATTFNIDTGTSVNSWCTTASNFTPTYSTWFIKGLAGTDSCYSYDNVGGSGRVGMSTVSVASTIGFEIGLGASQPEFDIASFDIYLTVATALTFAQYKDNDATSISTTNSGILAANSWHTVSLNFSDIDKLKVTLSAAQESYTTSFNMTPNTTPPSLSSSTPVDNSPSVAVDSNITLNFDENVVVGTGNITIHKTSDDSTVQTIDVTSGLVTGTGTSAITINPAANLVGSTEYYVQVPGSAFDDLSANSYAGISDPLALSFTTADIGVPSLSSSTPVDDALSVAVDSNITLNFDENVVVGTGNITIHKTSDDSTVQTIDVTSGLVTGAGTSAITINPAANLVGSTEYYVLIDATAFDDEFSLSYAGISSTTALSFTTADIANPSLTSSTPVDDAVSVAIDSNIVLNFDENIVVGTGNITIKKTADDSTIETISVVSGLVTGTSTSSITINPAADLAEGIEYYILIDATAFDDMAASPNSYLGISDPLVFSFTTISTALPNPFDNSEVVNLIQAQTNSVINIANQAIRPVNSRLNNLLSAPRDNLANNSHQGIQLTLISDSILNSAITQSGLLSGLNSSGDIFDNGWAIWTEGSVVLGKRKGGSDFQVEGITVGVDKRVTPSLTTGLALRIAQEEDDVGSTTSVDTDSYSSTAYGSYAMANDSYIQGALGYSDIDISSKRLSNTGEVSGDRDAKQVYMSLSLTHRYNYMGFTLLPYGSFDGSYSTLDTYSETGSNLALTYHEQTVKTLSATLGVRGSYALQKSYGLFTPKFHVNYQGDIKSDSDAQVSYISIPSTTYSQSYDANASSSWLIGLGLDYHYENLIFSADYERTQKINWGYSNTFRLMLNAVF